MSQSMFMYCDRSELINANSRAHWRVKARLVKAMRGNSGWHARSQLKPVTERVRIVATYSFPNARSLPDAGNLAPTTKACVDGLRDSKILRDDTTAYVIGEDSRVDVWSDRPGLVKITIELEDA